LGTSCLYKKHRTNNLKTILSEPVDKSGWLVPPHTVNAYHNMTSNEIVFPAGILQYPFYDLEASREQNLGGIGFIIAHEITHAFDNNGAQFDENGNMKNWWTQQDYSAFQQKCQEVINLFDGLEIAPGAVVNGTLTVSENVADIGAMACILDIAGNMQDVNYKELFESYARIWCLTGTKQVYQILTVQDVHSPNKFRVNQVLRNFQEFYDTYDVSPENKMYLAPQDRITIW
jgi:putative endopeptidase